MLLCKPYCSFVTSFGRKKIANGVHISFDIPWLTVFRVYIGSDFRKKDSLMLLLVLLGFGCSVGVARVRPTSGKEES